MYQSRFYIHNFLMKTQTRYKKIVPQFNWWGGRSISHFNFMVIARLGFSCYAVHPWLYRWDITRGRKGVLSGPLANTGILFAFPNFSTHGAEITPFLMTAQIFSLAIKSFTMTVEESYCSSWQPKKIFAQVVMNPPPRSWIPIARIEKATLWFLN